MMTYQILRSKRFWLFVVLPFILWSGYQVYQSKTLCFSSKRITSTFSYNPDLTIEEPTGKELDHLKAIFQQKFKFLAVGSQSYAFESEDGKYVIKFFIMKHLIPRVSDLWHPEKIDYRRQNLVSIFNAHKLAYDNIREDAGLVYIHLNKGSHFQTHLKAVDRLGRTHLIDLDTVEFVVQEKAELIFTHLKKLLKQGDKGAVKKSIASILQLVQRRIGKGISDHDKAVKHNYGFIGDRAVHLDIGRIEKVRKTKEYDRINQRINKWLQSNDIKTEGFSEAKICSSLPPHPQWSISSKDDFEEIRGIFAGRFKFLGLGAQSFAFESEDGKYVLKFFKMRRFTPSLTDRLCPHVAARRLRNLRWVFNGYKIAYDNFKKETGLIFIHLAKTDHLKQKVLVIDDKGKEHIIDLDKTEFVLQEKAELLFKRIARLYKAGDRQGAQKSIADVLELVKQRVDKGYADRDKAVSNNYGFVGDRAIQLDVGRLYKGVKEGQYEHIQRRIERWQEENVKNPK